MSRLCSPTQMGFPSPPSFISLDTFNILTSVVNTKWQGRNSNGHACSQPSLSLIAPWLLQGLIPCCAIADSSFPQQYHCNKLKWQNIEILCILCWGNQLSMCSVEIIFSTFLSFLADVSETQRFLGYGGDARWKVMPFTETSTYEGVREMRTPSLLLRVNPL